MTSYSSRDTACANCRHRCHRRCARLLRRRRSPRPLQKSRGFAQVFSRYVKSSALTFRRLSFLDMSMCALVVADRMPFAHARADARRRSRSTSVETGLVTAGDRTRRATDIGLALRRRRRRMDLAVHWRTRKRMAHGVSPSHTAKAFRPGSRGGVHAHFWMMRFPTRFAVTCQAKKRASALSVQPGSQSSFSASALTTGVQSATSGTAGNARSSPAATMPDPNGLTPAGRRGPSFRAKKKLRRRGPTGRSNVAPKVGGTLSCRPSGGTESVAAEKSVGRERRGLQ